MMDDRAELQLRAEILELRARIDLMASQQQAGGDSVIPSVPRQAGRMTLQTACSWDIIKRDGQKIWIRYGCLMSPTTNSFSGDHSVFLNGDGTFLGDDGHTVLDDNDFYLHAKLLIGVPNGIGSDHSLVLESSNSVGENGAGNETTRHYPLYRLKYDSTNNLITVLKRFQYNALYDFVPQFYAGWNKDVNQTFGHSSIGVLQWVNV